MWEEEEEEENEEELSDGGVSFSFLSEGGYSSRSRPSRDKYGPPVRTEYRLIVENLSSRCSWQDLKVRERTSGCCRFPFCHDQYFIWENKKIRGICLRREKDEHVLTPVENVLVLCAEWLTEPRVPEKQVELRKSM